jgi:hypothetical protein
MANPRITTRPARTPSEARPGRAVIERADVILIAAPTGRGIQQPSRSFPLRSGCRIVHLEEDPCGLSFPYWGYRTKHCRGGGSICSTSSFCSSCPRLRPSPPGRSQSDGARTKQRRGGARPARRRGPANARDAVPPRSSFGLCIVRCQASSNRCGQIVAQNTSISISFEEKPMSSIRGWVGSPRPEHGHGARRPSSRDRSQHRVCVLGNGAHPLQSRCNAAFGFAQEDHWRADPGWWCATTAITSSRRRERGHKYFPEGTAVRTGQFIGNVISPTADYPSGSRITRRRERITKPTETETTPFERGAPRRSRQAAGLARRIVEPATVSARYSAATRVCKVALLALPGFTTATRRTEEPRTRVSRHFAVVAASSSCCTSRRAGSNRPTVSWLLPASERWKWQHGGRLNALPSVVTGPSAASATRRVRRPGRSSFSPHH